MLRAVAISTRAVPIARAHRSTIGGQWRLARQFADGKTSDNKIFPGSQSKTASSAGVGLPPELSSNPGTPATPSSGSVILPQNVPRVPPPPSQVQTAPPTSIPPKATQTSAPPPATPPPPPPPPPKKRRFRNFLILFIVLSGLSYAGGVYYSLINDNFHDFFTEYVPFGEDTVLYFEEREFKRRFPDGTGAKGLHPQPRGEPKHTIGSKSGVSAKVSQDGNVTKDGKHVSAVEANTPKKDAAIGPSVKSKSPEKPNARPVEIPKKEEAKPAPSKPVEPKKVDTKEAPKPDVKKEDIVIVPKAPSSISRLDPLNVDNAADPMVQGVTKILNDIIAVVNADSAADKYSTTMSKAKDELKRLATDISDLKASQSKTTDETIKQKEAEFEQGAKELIKRIESEMKDQELRWREEYEAERQRLAVNYDERLNAELDAAQKVADQRLRNHLLEQDLKLRDEFTTSVKERIETERSGRLSKLNELSSSVEELQGLTSSWNEVVESNLKTQHLVVAVEAVRSILESADRPKPFIHELAVLKEIANDDAVVNAAIASINPSAYQRGIPTSAQLIDRFRRVAAEVRKAALLPEDAGVASHVASFMLSRVMFQKKGLAVGDDVESVLTRTETYLEEGNLDEAAREMNGLTGWAKVLCKDWLGDCRTVLEVRQALDVIATEARLQSLMVE